jgi:hypothetical protein
MKNSLGLYDIYGHWHVPFWQTRTFYFIIGLIIFIIISVIAWYLIKKYLTRKPHMPIWDEVLYELHDLKKRNIATTDQGKEFYCALTMSLKKYVHGRYELDCLHKTDDELMQFLQKNSFAPELLITLQEIFAGSTVIKFANAQAMQETIEKDLNSSITFVKQTIPTTTK